MDQVAILRLCRPAKRNALNIELIDGICRFFDDPPAAARAVVLHGEGEHFSAGLDLAKRIAGNTRLTNFAVMHALPPVADADPATGYLTESLISAIAASDDEAMQRLADFLEKRAARVAHG